MSKYARIEVDAGPFKDMMPEGGKIYMRHKLPEIEFKKDGVKYKMSDFQLLHPLGVRAFELCLDTILNVPGARECRLELNGDVDDDTKAIITDIVMGFGYTASKGGKHGFEIGSCVISGVTTEMAEGKNDVLVCHFGDHFSEYAYEYAHEHEGEKVTLAELVVYAVKRTKDEF